MTTEEYRLFRAWGGMSPVIWCERLNIARDTDKSYSSGRLKVSDKVAELVHHYAKDKYQKAQSLLQILQKELPEFEFALDETNLNINVFTSDGTLKANFSNQGLNNSHEELYYFGVQGKEPNVLIHKEKGRDKNWFLWRAGLKRGQLHPSDGYPHQITRDLLLACQGI